MELQTGDWVMIRKVKPLKLVHRGILLIADHTHDELLDCEGDEPVVGNAEPPHFVIVPWKERLAEFERGEIVMAVFRWHEADEPTFLRSRFYAAIHALIGFAADIEIGYDSKAIKTHARNFIRAFFKLRNLISHKKDHIYCTEGCFYMYKHSGVDLSADISVKDGIKFLVAPCHADQLYRDGRLKIVKDYGLLEYMSPIQKKE